MRKETRQKMGTLILAVIGFTSYFLTYFTFIPLVKYGPSFICFGPTKTIKENISVEKERDHEYLFSNGEIKTKNIFTKTYRVFWTILAIVVIYYIALFLYKFVFYVLGIDIMKLIYTGEWKRGEKMTRDIDYKDKK
ncbi:MAG: hypothetical protein LBU34_04835 [Planctomycetaceae bacterium]|jgi:hypothetical protein|nr:hypothetical protein [Planctomycetaceae bacterium]